MVYCRCESKVLPRDEPRNLPRRNKFATLWQPPFAGRRLVSRGPAPPRTTALARKVPGLNSAFFSILAPTAHIPPHRGVTKGLMTSA